MQEPFDHFAEGYEESLNRGLFLSGEPQEYFIKRRIQWLKECLLTLDFTLLFVVQIFFGGDLKRG